MPLVTRPNAKISAVNIGDAVVYQEPGKEQTVLGGVTAIIAQPTRKGGITLALKVHRLYQFHELREIFDNLAMYRDNPKLKDVDFRKVGENDPLVHDVEYQAAKRLYDQMEANVAQCFAGFPGLHHKVLVTALSDWTTTIAPEMVHEVLHLTLNSKVLENIGPSPDSEWPEKNADAIRMLSGVTVLWTSFLNTKTWTLHPVNLPPEAMTGRVLSAAARSMYWSPQGAVWGMVGTFRRYIDGRLKALGRHCSNQRQAVLSVPCSFNLFAFLVIATRNAQCFPLPPPGSLNPPRPPVGLSLPPTPTPFPIPSILLSEGRGLLIGLVILCSSTVPSLQIVDPSTRTVDSVSSTIFPCSALLNLPLGLRNKGTLCK